MYSTRDEQGCVSKIGTKAHFLEERNLSKASKLSLNQKWD